MTGRGRPACVPGEDMARGIQEHDVWAAADALLRNGEQPTIERVRLHLGRGSPNTVGPHLKAWFKSLSGRIAARAAPGQGGEGGAGVPEALTQAAAQMWQQALEHARAEWSDAAAQAQAAIDEARQRLEHDQAALVRERARLQAREADLEASVRAAHEQLGHAESRLRATEQHWHDAETRRRETAAALEAAQAQLAELQGSLIATRERHQEEIEHARAEGRAALANAESRHAAHERRWLGEIDEQRQALKRARDDADKARRHADATLAERQSVIARLTAERDAEARRAAVAESSARALTERAETLDRAMTSANARWEAHAAVLAEQTQSLREQLRAMQSQIEARDLQLERLAQLLASRESPSTSASNHNDENTRGAADD